MKKINGRKGGLILFQLITKNNYYIFYSNIFTKATFEMIQFELNFNI